MKSTPTNAPQSFLVANVNRDPVAYAEAYRGVDFRKHPEQYPIGRGEQGVLIAEPYKSAILAIGWHFRTPEIADESSSRILEQFYRYLSEDDFVGADMARKFLMMGWTRARRYANHPSGRKYGEEGQVLPQHEDALVGEKAQAAEIFKLKYFQAKDDEKYKTLAARHREIFKQFKAHDEDS